MVTSSVALRHPAVRATPLWRAALPVAVTALLALQAVELLLVTAAPLRGAQFASTLLLAASTFCAAYYYLAWRGEAKAAARAACRLEQLEADHSEDAALVVHDLENQLTVIGAALGLVLGDERTVDLLSPNQLECLELALNAQRKLVELLDEVAETNSDAEF
ncbi:MAG: hypothetical protein WCP21_08460 [Armatimonadota bacterium]